ARAEGPLLYPAGQTPGPALRPRRLRPGPHPTAGQRTLSAILVAAVPRRVRQRTHRPRPVGPRSSPVGEKLPALGETATQRGVADELAAHAPSVRGALPGWREAPRPR